MIPAGVISQQQAATVEPVNKFAIAGKSSLATSYNNGVPFPEQVQMTVGLGASMYRVGLVAAPDGSLSTFRHDFFFNTEKPEYPNRMGLVPQYAAAGIPCLCMISDRLYHTLGAGNTSSLWSAPTAEVYQAGYDIAFGVVTTYGEWFDYFELSNEVELFRDLLIQDSMGESVSDYRNPGSRPSLDVVAEYIGGMHAGVKAAKPTAKTMYNTAGYFARALMDAVYNYTPDIDIAAWHWYDDSTQGPIGDYIGNEYDIITYLYDRYGKEIWITESGTRFRENLTLVENEQRQVDWYNKFFSPTGEFKALSDPRVGKVFWFELLSQTEPYGPGGLLDYAIPGGGSGWEQNYGAYSFYDHATNGFSNPQPKLLAQQLMA